MAGKTNFTISLTARQVGQLNIVRGDDSREAKLLAIVAEYLEKSLPLRNTPEATFAAVRSSLFQRGNGGYPKPMENHPTIQEMLQWVTMPFPGPVVPGGHAAAERQFIERCTWAIEMENCGWPWTEIAETLGYTSVLTAQTAVNRFLARSGEQAAISHRSQARTRLDWLDTYLVEGILRPGYKYTVTGNLMSGPDGEFAIDMEMRARYADLFVKSMDRRARVDGSDMKESVKIDQGQLDYKERIAELVARVRTSAQPAQITGTLVEDDGEGSEEQAGGDADSPPVSRGDDSRDYGGDQEAEQGDDGENPVDAADGD